MSESDSQFHEVEDDEEYAARRRKEMILDAREDINKVGRQVAVDPAFEGHEHYALKVLTKQYIRQIAPLLRDETLPNANEYAFKIPLAEGTIPVEDKSLPKAVRQTLDSADTYAELAQHYTGHPRREMQAKQTLGLDPSQDLPKPEPFEINGLLSLLGTDTLSATWRLDMGGIGPNHKLVVLQNEIPVPQFAYENAVEAADTFLSNANLGLSIGEKDDDPLTV